MTKSIAAAAWLFLLFAALGLAVYWPALEGPFASDDLLYVATNPYVHALSLANLREIAAPGGTASLFVDNYTPVHLLLHALQWRFFGPSVVGYHVSNVLLHALGAVLLVAVFRASGIRRPAALLGGALFLLHPANVEAVAWISQLKTSASFVLSLCALLAFPAAPALATPLFFLALLAKPTAAFLIPVSAAVLAVRLWPRVPVRRHLVWLGVWTAGFVLLSMLQIEVNRRSATPDAGAEGLARIGIVATIGLRYVVMSASSIGVSAFHDPPRTLALSNPWLLASLPLLALLVARGVRSAMRRTEEAVYWVWAAASFAPISQIFPFLYPMADRYLYFILPGLLGALLLLSQDALARLEPRLAQLVLAVGLALALVFGVRSHERARLWGTPSLLLADSARHYPEGAPAQLLRAKRAAQEGDVDGAVLALRAASARGFKQFRQLDDDPAYAAIRGDARFRGVVREMAGWWIERSARLQHPTQLELHVLADAYLAQGERAKAVDSLEAALARGGPIDDLIRSELAQLRRPGG